MRRIASLFTLAVLATCLAGLVPAGAGAATFPQCPPVSHDTGCQFLITVGSKGVQVAEDSTQPPYEASDDALIGIVNSSSKPISAIPLSTENSLFGFEIDGICNSGEPLPAGCVEQAKNSSGEANEHPGEACPPATTSCGFVPPPGEPPNNTFPAGILINGIAANGDAVSGYEGPRTWFTSINPTGFTSGVVNFSPALAPGESTYFGLESPPAGKLITVGNTSTVTTSLTGEGVTGPSITVAQGASVSDVATIGGPAGATATGTVTFKVFKDPACTQPVGEAGSAEVVNGVSGPSTPAAKLAPGTYYWQATYGGDINNQPAVSVCGTEVLKVAKKLLSSGLPSAKKCLSKRHFIAHPKAPRHVKLVKVEVRINGILKLVGKLTAHHTFIDLRGLPKGTFHVLMITTSSTGQTYGDQRTFHTCVPGHHKKKK